MKAMILAAGLGTRLRPLTDDRPKALVEIAGRTMLEITLSRLHTFGIREVIINVHHFADMIIAYLRSNDNFGMSIEVSREEVLLDTGGGLKKAAHFFLEDSSGAEEPFILHNVDILSTIDLRRMVQFHTEHQALATLAVQERETSRYLLFDEQTPALRPAVRTRSHTRTCAIFAALAGAGFFRHPRYFSPSLGNDAGRRDVLHHHLLSASAAREEKILAFRADEYYWRDLGSPANLAQAAQDLKRLSAQAEAQGQADRPSGNRLKAER